MMTGVAGILIWWMALGSVNATPANRKVQLYQEALQLVQKSQYKQAIKRWQRLIDLFELEQKKHPPHSRERNQQLVGQCNTLYHLAQTQWQARLPRASCLTRAKLEQKRKTISPRWLKFVSDGSLPKLFLASKTKLLTACAKVPSLVVLKATPAAAKIEMQVAPKAAWKPVKGKTVAVSATTIALRANAPGHKAWEQRKIGVPRWHRVTVNIAMKKGAAVANNPAIQPRRRIPASRRKIALVVGRRVPPRRRLVVARRAPPRVARIVPRIEPRKRPAPPPFYKTWWFWTVTGVVVAGGATAAIVAATTLTGTKIIHDPTKPYQIGQ